MLTRRRGKRTQNARAMAYMQPYSMRSPSQIAPNVQRARNRALIARWRGGRFPDCLRVRKCVPGTKGWRAKCVARGAMCVALSEGHFQAEISRRGNDISKEVYCLPLRALKFSPQVAGNINHRLQTPNPNFKTRNPKPYTLNPKL